MYPEYDETDCVITDIVEDAVNSEDFQAGLAMALSWAKDARLGIQVDVGRATDGQDIGEVEHLDTVIRELEAMQAKKRKSLPTLEQVADAMIGLIHELKRETATTG